MVASATNRIDDKIESWKSRLIDLTKRNRLLNFRETKLGSLKIVQPNVEEVFSWIFQNEKPMVFRWDDTKYQKIQEAINKGINNIDIEMKKGELLTPNNEIELNKTLYNLRIKSRTAFLEQGVNILYLALGFLEWTEAEYSDVKIKSPIFLVPVEITRESISKPYSISLLEDELILNPTLVQKVQSDFGISLPSLPDDLDSIDIQKEFQRIKDMIKEIPNWNITNDVYLGLFSFKKFVMYKDLETNIKIAKEHPIIGALSGDPSKLPPIPDDLPSGEEIDQKVSPEETYQVLDADSSQQEAIIAAKKGVSLIIQGPPGTGKSQTITNIIAECLTAGQTVLFVSEKMAALEVVKNRLDACGLGQFCLELHSHKANRRKVIEELSKTLESPVQTTQPGKKLEFLKQLKTDRDKLNDYVSALHKPRTKLNMTPYQIHGELARVENAPNLLFDFPRIVDTDQSMKNKIDILLNQLIAMGQVFENYFEHPWFGCQIENFSFQVQSHVLTDLNALKGTILSLDREIQPILLLLQLDKPRTMKEVEWLCDVVKTACETPFPPEHWVSTTSIDDLIATAKEAETIYHEYFEIRKYLLSKYSEKILKINVIDMLKRFESDYRGMFRFLKSGYRQDMLTLQKLYRRKRKLRYYLVLNHLNLIKKVLSNRDRIMASKEIHQAQFGKWFRNDDTDWEEILSGLEWTKMMMSLFPTNNVPKDIISIVTKQNEKIEQLKRYEPGSYKIQMNEKLKAEIEDVEKILPIFKNLYARKSVSELSLSIISVWIENRIKNIDKLHEWIDFKNILTEGEKYGLCSFIGVALNNRLKADQIQGAFHKHFYQLWLDSVYGQDEVLKRFNSSQHQLLIDQFRELDFKQLDIAKLRAQQIIAGRRPQSYWVDAPSSEQTIIKREMAKKRRHKHIRQLFSEIRNLLPVIKPCMLMSPLSVSQFIDPDIIQFDIVIFDEASQICPEDAIGSIMRGKKLIVVGDDKQLPPTSFFMSSGLDEFDEEKEDTEILESILDECNAIGLPSKMLMWHYRSKHEDLIAFSNYHFYENRLNTFPNSKLDKGEMGIEFINVPTGIYDRGKTRKNDIEAKKVVNLVFEHFEKNPNKSLGIVAFSEAQQMAILDEIERRRIENPRFEALFDENKPEPFFVRNLENVQGDERDVMFFSVGYGKDSIGKMTLNFGPLNSEGGQRRLNVAITRARYNVKLIASIQPTDIDVSRTHSRGVQLLKNYMEYAIQGSKAIFSEIKPESRLDFESPFEEEVCKALTERGLTVHKQIGCSCYRIDLAVVDSEKPGHYLLGIECDGAAYHSAKTARDRDRLRQQILEELGWHIHRIWSRDWIENPKREVDKVIEAIRQGSNYANILMQKKKSNSIEKKQPSHIVTSTQLDVSKKKDQLPRNVIPYRKIRIRYKGDQKEFYKNRDEISQVLYDVVQTEGPIHIVEASRRVAEFWFIQKAGSKIQNIVYSAAIHTKGIVIRGSFIWRSSMKKPPVRTPQTGDNPRDIEMIAVEEIAEAAYLCIENAFTLTIEDTIQQTARLLGFDRTGDQVRRRIIRGIELLRNGRRIKKQDKDHLRIVSPNHP